MPLRAFLIGCAVVFVMVAAPRGVHAAEAPRAVVERLHRTLLANMKDAAALDYIGRRDRLARVVHDVFDLETMTRMSIGAVWQKMSGQERAELVHAFTNWTVANYASQFDSFDGESFVTTNEKDAGRGNVLVNTELRAKIETVTLNYRLRRTGDVWRIIDIYMDGVVSQLAMRRGEFAAVVGKGGIDKLISHMRALVTKLAAGS